MNAGELISFVFGAGILVYMPVYCSLVVGLRLIDFFLSLFH